METQTTKYEGNLKLVQMVNKRGKKVDMYDYFFVINNKDYFVKTKTGTVSREELDAWYKQSSGNLLKIEGLIQHGLWDTDDPKQQSRVGSYILIYKILK